MQLMRRSFFFIITLFLVGFIIVNFILYLSLSLVQYLLCKVGYGDLL